MGKSKIIISVLVVLIIASLSFFLLSNKEPMLNDIHTHADVMVFLDGAEFDLAQQKYMSKGNLTLSPFVHLHDADGDIIHKHIKGVTLDEFFTTLGMDFSKECFITDNKKEYCNNAEKKVVMLVNGKENKKFGNYEFKDLDRILIYYGSDDKTLINGLMQQVTDKACIQSGKCPERGIPYNESSCTTEGGCTA